MAECAELLKEIDKLPQQYIGKVFDYINYLHQTAKNDKDDEVAAYKAMAADTDREQEASEWCNSYFGPINQK